MSWPIVILSGLSLGGVVVLLTDRHPVLACIIAVAGICLIAYFA